MRTAWSCKIYHCACHAILLLDGREFGEGSQGRSCVADGQLSAGRMLRSSALCTPSPEQQWESARRGFAQLPGGCKEHFIIISWCYLMERIAWWCAALSPPPTGAPAVNINLGVLCIFQVSVHRRVSLLSEWLTDGDGLRQIQATLHGRTHSEHPFWSNFSEQRTPL